jgi:stage II sporulation protein AA (anti-sigma F factor antagonist)
MAKDFFQLTVSNSVNVMDLALPESLDSEEFDALNESMLKTVEEKAGDRWVLDLSSVNYMGSSVLGLMINFRQHIKTAGGQLALCGLSPKLMRIFHTCCLEKLFVITRNRSDALTALGK